MRRLAHCCTDLHRNRPFTRRVSCDRPVHLITVTPAFRLCGRVSQRCDHLSFRFCQFAVANSNSHLDFRLTGTSSNTRVTIRVTSGFRPFLRSSTTSPTLAPTQIVKQPPESLEVPLRTVEPRGTTIMSTLQLRVLRFSSHVERFNLADEALCNLTGKRGRVCGSGLYTRF